MVVVTRHYGGTKLGAGGLVRTYGGAAAECLRAAERVLVRPRIELSVRVGFEQVSALYHVLSGFEVERGEEGYDTRGLHLSLQLFPEDVSASSTALRDATRGQAEVEVAPIGSGSP